jgi:hypothetical protein
VLRTEKFAGDMGPPASTLKGVRMRDFDPQTMRRDARTLLDAAFRLPLSRLPHQSRRHGPWSTERLPYCLTSSTRRFRALPASSSFEATGAHWPRP